MRPLKLKMQAFGSYIQPVTLDFENNLRDTKIFLINGVTGAGKTTILDAICYALYGKASGNDRDGAMMRSKGIADDVKMKVELSFALGEKIYKVNRELSYRPNRKTPIQITAELLCGDDVLETKSTAVTNRIKDLLGFDADQFRQVVLLPQGEFSNFLKATADDRQRVLNALFKTETYKKIEDGLKLKADAVQEVFNNLIRDKDALTAQLQGSQADDAALEKLRADCVAAQEKAAALKKIFDDAQRKYTAGEILAGDFAELEKRIKVLVAAKNNLDQAAKVFDAAKTEYELRNAERPRRDKLKGDIDKLAKIKESLAELDAKKKSLDTAEKNLWAAKDALKDFQNKADKYDRRIADLKKRRGELTGAEKNLAEARILLKRACEREQILQEIARLEADLKRAQQKIVDAEKSHSDANLKLERLQTLQREGSAALLAKNLRDGNKCPVCGSRTHPELARTEKIIPSDQEIKTAQQNADKLKQKLDAYKITAAQIETAISTKRDDLKKFADVSDKATVQKIVDAAQIQADESADCDRRIAKGEQCIADNKKALNDANDKQTAALNAQAQLFGEWQTTQKNIPQEYLSNQSQLDADFAAKEKSLRELDAAWKDADENFRKAGNEKSSCEGAFTTAQKSKDALDDKLKDKTPPDVDALKSRADDAQKNHAAAIRAEAEIQNKLNTLTNLSAQLAELDKKICAAERTLRIWKRLSDAAGGKISGNKLSFTRYYLSFMFDQVVTEANYLLAKMSDRRYSFQKKIAGDRAYSTLGLNLEIFDEYTGANRPVATLSGGESFLASLSLALGLAAVVRNNAGGIKLDTIFIDEGFGSLDNEALDYVMKALLDLQSGGRLVGIISHVEELKKQIPVQLEVKTSKTGSKAEFKRGLSHD